MAITGTKVPQTGGTLRNYFVNNCTIDSVTGVDSPYHDCSLHVKLTDTSGNDYTYNLFVNQNFKKDKAGVVTDLAFPDNLNLLYLHTGTDLNVSDKGDINLEELVGKQIAVINYLSNGKYKKQTWQRVGSIDDHEALNFEFSKSIKAGYPKDFIGYGEQNMATAADVEATFNGNADDGLPF